MSQLLLTGSDVEIGLAPACPREGLRTVRPQEVRSIDAVKHGQELQALVTAARATQDRRRTSRSSPRSTLTRSSVVVTG